MVTLALLALVWGYSLWDSLARLLRATELVRLEPSTPRSSSKTTASLVELLSELREASHPDARRALRDQLVVEIEYALSQASAVTASVRIPLAATVSGGVFAWWNDRAVAWTIFGIGALVSSVCWALGNGARARARRARARFRAFLRQGR